MRKGRRKREKNVAQTPRKFVMRVTGDASTPFDDVFKTTLTDHKSLAIPMINFVFEENYTGDERIELLQTERFIKQAGSKQQKRIMDSYILIWRGNECRAYVIECQTNPDGTILIRMFEYSFLAAMDLAELVDNVLTVPFPKMAMVALRSWKNFPNKMKVRFKAPNGKSLTWKVPVVKVGDYTWQTMIEKGLLALLPFYIFNYETRFPELDADEAKLAAATADFERMMEALDELVQQGKLSEYTARSLREMMAKVLEHLAAKYENVKEKVGAVMGGNILSYKAKDIFNEGKAEGKAEGRAEGWLDAIIATARRMLEDGMSPERVSHLTTLPLEQVESLRA